MSELLPFAILADELAALERFYECVMDDEGYDVPKEMMRRLAEIGLVRHLCAGRYECTTFGLSVLHGDFNRASPATPAEDARDAERAELHLLEAVCTFYANDEDRFLKDEGEPYGSIPTEVGMKARAARNRFNARERAAMTQGEK